MTRKAANMTTKAKAAEVADETTDAVTEPPLDDLAEAAAEHERGELERDGSMGDSGGHDDPSICVVDDGRCVGRAVNGRVCSYHAAAYRPDGTPR